MQPTEDHSMICFLNILDQFAQQKREAVKLLLFALEKDFGITVSDIFFAIYEVTPEDLPGRDELIKIRTKLPRTIAKIEKGEIDK